MLCIYHDNQVEVAEISSAALVAADRLPNIYRDLDNHAPILGTCIDPSKTFWQEKKA